VRLLGLHQGEVLESHRQSRRVPAAAGKGVSFGLQFGSNTIHHLFCSRCGVKSFGRDNFEELGGDFYAINVACLDNAATKELAEAPIRYEDGRHNKWESPPAETRHL
jgi:hypothetical protein